jgi:hypothetical protein
MSTPRDNQNKAGLCRFNLLKRKVNVKESIKIMHIDGDYRVVTILIRDGSLIKSPVVLEDALTLLKNFRFDLILSEPQHLAILTPRPAIKE